MADNILIKDGNSSDQNLASTDVSGVHFTKHILSDNGGNLVGVTGGGLEVSVQDATQQIVDLYMHEHVGSFTLDSGVVADGDTLAVTTDGTVPVVGNLICLKEGTLYYQGQILAVTPVAGNQYTLLMDSPLDQPYTVAAVGSLTEHDLSVDGSSTKVEYHIKPNTGVNWHITRILLYIEDDATMDDGTFGGISALYKGIVIRKKNASGYHNVFNAKTNGEFAQRAYDRQYQEKPPSGSTGSVVIRRSFNGPDKNGTVIALDGTIGEELQIVIQDNLAGLTHFHAIVQGHVTSE